MKFAIVALIGAASTQTLSQCRHWVHRWGHDGCVHRGEFHNFYRHYVESHGGEWSPGAGSIVADPVFNTHAGADGCIEARECVYTGW